MYTFSYHVGIDFPLHNIVSATHARQTSFDHEYHSYISALVEQCLELFGKSCHDLFFFVKLQHGFWLKFNIIINN